MRSGFDLSALLALSTVVLGLALFVSSVPAQGVCPIKTVKLGLVRGTVVENSPSRIPIPNVLVELRSADDDEHIIASTRTDERGSFRFGPLQKGKYALDFRHEFFAGYRLIVKKRGSNPSERGLKGSSVLVMLGSDCFNTEVSLEK